MTMPAKESSSLRSNAAEPGPKRESLLSEIGKVDARLLNAVGPGGQTRPHDGWVSKNAKGTKELSDPWVNSARPQGRMGAPLFSILETA